MRVCECVSVSMYVSVYVCGWVCVGVYAYVWLRFTFVSESRQLCEYIFGNHDRKHHLSLVYKSTYPIPLEYLCINISIIWRQVTGLARLQGHPVGFMANDVQNLVSTCGLQHREKSKKWEFSCYVRLSSPGLFIATDYFIYKIHFDNSSNKVMTADYIDQVPLLQSLNQLHLDSPPG